MSLPELFEPATEDIKLQVCYVLLSPSPDVHEAFAFFMLCVYGSSHAVLLSAHFFFSVVVCVVQVYTRSLLLFSIRLLMF